MHTMKTSKESEYQRFNTALLKKKREKQVTTLIQSLRTSQSG